MGAARHRRAAAEAECRKAARAGHFRASALLRLLPHVPEPVVAGRAGGESPEARITELIALWDTVSGLTPDPDNCVDHLAARTGLPREDIDRVRRVRNRCAHPAERGWPTGYEVDLALTIAAELQRRVVPS